MLWQHGVEFQLPDAKICGFTFSLDPGTVSLPDGLIDNGLSLSLAGLFGTKQGGGAEGNAANKTKMSNVVADLWMF